MDSFKNNRTMRKFIILFFLSFTAVTFAQTKKPNTAHKSPAVVNTSKQETDSFKIKVDSSLNKVYSTLDRIEYLMEVNNQLTEHLEINTSLKNRYKLYQTENIYNLLLLDTKTGKIDQVQWSLERNEEGSVMVNGVDLSNGYGSGCFELYPTKNMYQFILLDKTDGRKWHVQWGTKSTERWIRRIY